MSPTKSSASATPKDVASEVKWDKNGLFRLAWVESEEDPDRTVLLRVPVLGPCTDSPNSFDADGSTAEQVAEAIRICDHCPFLRQCAEYRDYFYAHEHSCRSASHVWAGAVVDHEGHLVPPSDLPNFMRHRVQAKKREAAAYERARPDIERRLRELQAADPFVDAPALSDARPGRRRGAVARKQSAA